MLGLLFLLLYLLFLLQVLLVKGLQFFSCLDQVGLQFGQVLHRLVQCLVLVGLCVGKVGGQARGLRFDLFQPRVEFDVVVCENPDVVGIVVGSPVQVLDLVLHLPDKSVKLVKFVSGGLLGLAQVRNKLLSNLF